MSRLYIILLIPFLFTSCFKEDERITPYDRGNKVTETVEMTQTYKYQVYYSLEDSLVIASNSKQTYDLIFESHEDGYHILLNTANFMMAARTAKHSFDAVSNAANLDMTFDPSDGNRSEAALKDWIQVLETDTVYSGELYVIDRGFDDLGNMLGYRKLIIDSLKGDTYYFRYALLNGNEIHSASVTKDPQTNYAYYSFESHEQVFPEPNRESYDLLFTQYTTLLFTNIGEPYPYLVTGVLLNRHETLAVQDSLKPFDELSMENALALEFTNRQDAIGYDWKDVEGDVSNGMVYYDVHPEFTYFIRNQHGYYFKLRFIGFYNHAGEKGYPTFEFQRL